MQPFIQKNLDTKFDCPNAQYIHSNGFYFGNNPELTKDEINLFKELLKGV